MCPNMGKIDRIVRILLGLSLIGLTLTGQIGWWGWLGLIPVASGLLGFCGVYRLLGISTGGQACKVAKD